MEFTALLQEAEAAPPMSRIEWRDRIAAHGARAIDGVRPWLESGTLAAFAIRVIERAGVNGEAKLASQVLRSARARVPAAITGDIDWALQQIRLVGRAQPAVAERPSRVGPPLRREAPTYTPGARRRAR